MPTPHSATSTPSQLTRSAEATKSAPINVDRVGYSRADSGIRHTSCQLVSAQASLSSVPGLPASARAAAAAATAGRRAGATRAAANRDRREQPHGVLVALRAGAWSRRLAHRPGALEGISACAAAVLVSGHVIDPTPGWY